jgi:predicted nucleic acid-binding protein
MDLLIAASALVEGVPLVTRNASHFEHIPDLRLLRY